MRKLLTVALVATTMTVAWTLPAQAEPTTYVQITHTNGEKVDGQYIVTFKDDAPARFAAQSLDTEPLFTYSTVLDGFTAKLSASELKSLQRNPQVAMIEEDGIVTVDATQINPPWGLDRIDQHNLPLSNTYTYNRDGRRVNAYIIDTGIDTGHPEFGGRATNVFNSAGGSASDCNGHGTHVAGTVGARTYGVAKAVNLRGVKVLNCAGSGTWAGVIAGMDWVAAKHVKPAVANMSLGGSFNASVNNAATAMANRGVFTAVAAGNNNGDACNISPASANNVTTVAASDINDARASFSNFGKCVEVYAPGVAVKSTWLSGGTNTISGTSMASPHVAGVGALYKSNFGDAASAVINNWVVVNATPGVITGNPPATPNRLLYKAGL